MSGAELLPVAASAVAKASEAVESAQKESHAVAASLRESAKNSPAWERAGDVYARRQLVKQEFLLKLFQPLAKIVGVSQEYFTTSEFERDLAEKLEGVAEEALAPPTPTVAGPAIESMRYALGDAELKDLFLNLLATASLQSEQRSAHPSFVEVIKQLSGEEAAILRALLPPDVSTIIRISAVEKPSLNFVVLENNVMNLSAEGLPVVQPGLATFIDNWVRLGLVQVRYDENLTAPNVYDWAQGRPELAYRRARFVAPPVTDENVRWEVECQNGTIRATDFGKQFRAVVIDGTMLHQARTADA